MKTAVITKVEKCPGRLLFTAFFLFEWDAIKLSNPDNLKCVAVAAESFIQVLFNACKRQLKSACSY